MKKRNSFFILALFTLFIGINNAKSNVEISPNLSASIPTDTIKGDYNGDGKMDLMFSNCTPCVDENSDDCFCKLLFTGKIPSKRVDFCLGSVSYFNLGDLNEDGNDEVGFINNWHSNWTSYTVITLKNNEWVNLIDPITIFLPELLERNLIPIQKDPKHKGHVIVSSCKWEDDVIIVTESVRVN